MKAWAEPAFKKTKGKKKMVDPNAKVCPPSNPTRMAAKKCSGPDAFCEWNAKDKCFKRCSQSDEQQGYSCAVKTVCGYYLMAADTLMSVIARLGILISNYQRQNGQKPYSAQCNDRSSSNAIKRCCAVMSATDDDEDDDHHDHHHHGHHDQDGDDSSAGAVQLVSRMFK